MTTWIELNIDARLVTTLAAARITTPSAVQAASIPHLLAGTDVSARSQTGSGKTLAYLLPALMRIDATSPALQALVLAPTQELAMQIYRVASHYAEPLHIRVQQLIGGASAQRQVDKLREKPQLVVGTPGRVHELMKLAKLKLHQLHTLVVDEADQVFQLGSTAEVEALIKAMDRTRQMAFFSATRPPAMQAIEERYMQPSMQVVDIYSEGRLPQQIEHFYVQSERRDKIDTARKLLRLFKPSSALLFINDTEDIANIESKLSFEGFAVETLYGDADKQQRAATIQRFRDGRCEVLLATDVAARGLDVEAMPLVLQLDPAPDEDHYVHRAGRTGRMGNPGTVITIVEPNQTFIMTKFERALEISISERVMRHGKWYKPDELHAYRERDNKPVTSPRVKQQPAVEQLAKPALEVETISAAAPARMPKKTVGKAGGHQKAKSGKSKDKGAPKWLKDKRQQ